MPISFVFHSVNPIFNKAVLLAQQVADLWNFYWFRRQYGSDLHAAAGVGQVSVIRTLVKLGADIHAKARWHGETVLHFAAADGRPLQMGRALRAGERRANLDIPIRRAGMAEWRWSGERYLYSSGVRR